MCLLLFALLVICCSKWSGRCNMALVSNTQNDPKALHSMGLHAFPRIWLLRATSDICKLIKHQNPNWSIQAPVLIWFSAERPSYKAWVWTVNPKVKAAHPEYVMRPSLRTKVSWARELVQRCSCVCCVVFCCEYTAFPEGPYTLPFWN